MTSNNIITLRRHDLDNLRTFLTGLVTAHHTSLLYGGVGGTPMRSDLIPRDAQTAPLLLFNAFNQSFFMGTFFWISGRVSAQSLSKGRRWQFVKSKAVRLLFPAVGYTLFVAPVTGIMCLDRWTRDAMGAHLTDYFVSLRGIRGAVWYTATLFAFDVVAALIPATANAKTEKRTTGLKGRYEYLGRYGWLGVAGTSFLARLYYPCNGPTIKPLSVQGGYLPQYIFAYAMGHLSYHADEDLLPGPARLSTTTASMLALAAFPLCFFPFVGQLDVGKATSDIMGGWNLGAAAYALWNELAFALIAPALVETFNTKYNTPAQSAVFQPRYSYAAFMAHVVVFVATGLIADSALRPVASWTSRLWKVAGPLVMTGVMSAVNVFGSFVTAKLALEHVPGLRRIL